MPRTFELRDWQKRFLEAYIEGRKRNETIFNFEATMGAGKSVLCAELASRMLEHEGFDYVIQVVPWDSIRGNEFGGMVRAYDQKGIRTHTTLFVVRGDRVTHQPFPGKVAFVVTYQAVCGEKPVELVCESWKSRKPDQKIGLILDEIHHTNTDAGSWGSAVETLSEAAAVTVTMSGTYFRTDRKPIKFLTYNEAGRPKLSCPAYTYFQAIRDKVVRPVAFRFADPFIRSKCERSGEGVHRLSEFEKGRKFDKAKREVLAHDSEQTRDLILQSHEYLDACRRKFPDAGLLFTCQPSPGTDEERYVHRIANAVSALTREPVCTVVSSDPNSAAKLERFKAGKDPYLVAINQVSEGVDIPRLRAVTLFRYTDSEMLFRQIVGRALRYTDNEDGTAAMVFMLKFRAMYDFAVNMYNESLLGIKDFVCQQCGEYPCICACEVCGENPCVCVRCLPTESIVAPQYDILDVMPEFSGGAVGEHDVRERSVAIAKAIKAQHVQHSTANEVQLAHALQCAEAINAAGLVEEESVATPLETLGKATRRVHRLMGTIVPRFFGGDWGKAWVQLFRNRYGLDWREAAITWDVQRMEEFAGVLEAYIDQKKVTK